MSEAGGLFLRRRQLNEMWASIVRHDQTGSISHPKKPYKIPAERRFNCSKRGRIHG